MSAPKKTFAAYALRHAGRKVVVELGREDIDGAWRVTHVVKLLSPTVFLVVATYTSRPHALRHARRLRAALKLEKPW